MSWRSNRAEGKAEQTLAAATIARVTSEEASRHAGESAVRTALATAELERPIDTVVIVALDDGRLSEDIGAALRVDREVAVARVDEVRVEEVDAAFAVAHTSMPARDVVVALARLDSILLGVLLADDAVALPLPDTPPPSPDFDAELEQHVSAKAPQPPTTEDFESGTSALEALAELERATESSAASHAPPAVANPDLSLAIQPRDEVNAEHLVDPDHAEAPPGHRLRALKHETHAATIDNHDLADAERRATLAEQRVRELEQQLARLARPAASPPIATEKPAARPPAPPLPAPPPPTSPSLHVGEPTIAAGTHTMGRLEDLVREAQRQRKPQAEEWAYYLPLLREHADTEGRLPASFDSLVDSVFGDALSR